MSRDFRWRTGGGCLVVALHVLLTGCASSMQGPARPPGPPPEPGQVIPLMVSDADRYLSRDIQELIPPKGEYGAVLAFRSPRPDEAPPSPYDADVRRQLVRSLAADPSLASRCDIISVAADQAAGLDEHTNWQQAITIAGDVDLSQDPKTYHPQSVYVALVGFSKRPSGNGEAFELDLRLWSPQRRTWLVSRAIRYVYYPGADGSWVRAAG